MDLHLLNYCEGFPWCLYHGKVVPLGLDQVSISHDKLKFIAQIISVGG